MTQNQEIVSMLRGSMATPVLAAFGETGLITKLLAPTFEIETLVKGERAGATTAAIIRHLHQLGTTIAYKR